MNFEELEERRHSVRKYKAVPVEEEKLEKIMEAGRKAPTAKNRQPVKVYVLKSEEAHRKIDALTPCRYHAPICFMICARKKEAYTYPETRATFTSEIEDATLIYAHMMLEAEDLGLSTCIVNNFSPLQAKEAFALPEDEMPIALLDLGYDNHSPVSPFHQNKKPLDELFETL